MGTPRAKSLPFGGLLMNKVGYYATAPITIILYSAQMYVDDLLTSSTTATPFEH